MRSAATDVPAYLAGLPAERRAPLTLLRELCLAELPGHTEVMGYGMPVYRRDGVDEIAFAAQKRYISVYLLRSDVRTAFAARLAGYDMGKGCLRFRKEIDVDLVRDLLRATAAGDGPVSC
ncbi:iron chaperone [Nocardia sp. NPDC059177]|uniref:iron chaperone n=1 Tax=Nocardia sp. NPDC059177 TaxID=3346759 RepID=UPI0036A23BC5